MEMERIGSDATVQLRRTTYSKRSGTDVLDLELGCLKNNKEKKIRKAERK